MSVFSKNLLLFFGILIISTLIVSKIVLHNIQQPIIDLHSFRQSQTAITAYWFDWEKPIQSFFNYDTPEFGVPWKVPFEFPLYQAIVSAVSQVSGLAIHTSGRLTSLAFFFLTLLPLASLAKGLDLGRRFFFFTAVFWLASPLYLYWSRTVMIESTAVFLGFVFLASVERAYSNRKWHWWLIAFVTSLACALVKVTTYPTFGLAAAGMIVWKSWPGDFLEFKQKETFRRFLLPLLGLVFLGLGTVAMSSAWTQHADSIKMQNEITKSLTSNNLDNFLFGTLAQKIDPENWKKILDRSIPEAIGSYIVLGFILGLSCFLRGKKAVLLFGFLVLFLLPFAIFTNLHLVHNYYQYANSFWLVLALGLSVSEMSKHAPLCLVGAVVLAIVSLQIQTYSETYSPYTLKKTSGDLEVAKFISDSSNEHQSILVIGDDWSPEIAFHSGRRAVYIPCWLNHDTASALFEKISNNPELVFGTYNPSFVIININKLETYPQNIRQKIGAFLLKMGKSPNSKRTRIAEYELLKIKERNKALSIEMAQSEKPQLDSSQTQELFDSLTQKTLGNSFPIENCSAGIFLHPGGQPTEAIFDIAGKFHGVRLAGFITELPQNGLDDPLAGTTGVEIFVDGQSQGRCPVDRFTNQIFSLDLTNAKELKVVVDCANGTANWDHFYLGVAK